MASADAEKAGATAAAAASPAGPTDGGKSSSSDLDSIFASLEEQEEKADREGGFCSRTSSENSNQPFLCRKRNERAFSPLILDRLSCSRLHESVSAAL